MRTAYDDVHDHGAVFMKNGLTGPLTRREVISALFGSSVGIGYSRSLFAAGILVELGVEPQPYFANVRRVTEALGLLGQPLSAKDQVQLLLLANQPSSTHLQAAEEILDQYTLMRVQLARDGSTKATPGTAPMELVEQGWRCFLVRVENSFGLRVALEFPSFFPASWSETGVISAEGTLTGHSGRNFGALSGPQIQQIAAEYHKYWMGYQFYTGRPMGATLSGIGVEYLVLQLFSRDRGRKAALLMLQPAGQPPFVRNAPFAQAQSATASALLKAGTGFRATFNCFPSRDVRLEIKDWDGAGCVASILVRDETGRLYPAPAHRIAPDFDFQPQVYRADEETVRLPDGRYVVEAWRGPEYIRQSQSVQLDSAAIQPHIRIRLERWINAAALGWYPGETHIHAAGCAHYEIPTQGVTPETMIRHVRGEALAIGDILTWAPGYDYQSQFFSGHVYEPTNTLEVPELQQANGVSLKPRATPHDAESLIRYDMEISGFPSSHAGHLVLLRLRDQNYPGAKKITDWPSWNLPILKWARVQGAVVGYAHCGPGMATDSTALPNYEIPPFDNAGANECIVDVTHGAVDFMSGAETSPVAELNGWYHILNCGFRVAMVGETDFPCLFDERVGVGRSYVGLDQPPADDTGYQSWVEGIRQGRLYFGDGRSHFIDYRINGHDLGGKDVQLPKPQMVTVTAGIAARLEEKPLDVANLAPWHLEHARIGDSRRVYIEVVVNGETVVKKPIEADGRLRDISLKIRLERSCWVALRILPSGHTAPVFVGVAGKPIRASRRSARWCRHCVDKLWEVKSPFIREGEIDAAALAFDHARATYEAIIAECEVD